MISLLLDLGFVLLVAVTTVVVASRLVVESTLIFIAVLLSCLISMAFFEPLAGWCSVHLFSQSDVYLTRFLWFFYALAIFVIALTLLLQFFFQLVGEPPQLGKFAENVGCWIVGAVTGYLLAAFVLTLVHTIPGPRDFWGGFEPEAQHRSSPIIASAPDYQFLSLVDYIFTPRAPLSGSPWKLGGPAVKAEFKKGRWASFPIRYAIWREALTLLLSKSEDRAEEFVEYDVTEEDLEPVTDATDGATSLTP